MGARDRILSAAVELVLDEGPSGFETRTVADKAQVNQSQVNYYFGSRDGLLAHVASVIYDQYVGRVVQRVSSAEDPREGLNNYVDEVVDFNRRHPGAGTLAAYPHLFAVTMEEWQSTSVALHTLDSSERLSVVVLSCMYAIHFKRPYRLLDRSQIANFHQTYPRITHAAAAVSLAIAGYGQEWNQRWDHPIYGLELSTLLRRAVMQIADDLQAVPAEAQENEALFV